MKEIYSWVQWFRELARKIEKGGEAYLIEKAKLVAWGGNPSLLRYDDEGIDPFSFFYFLASKNTRKQLKRVYDSVSSVFEIESPLPDTGVDDYYIFPTPNFKILFHDGVNFYPDLLWRLFREAVKDNPNIGPDDFKKALNIKQVGVAKLTQTLFLINPGYFPPVDGSIGVLSEALDLPAQIEKEILKDGGYEDYISVQETLKKAFFGCQPYEINMFLYLQKSEQIINSNSNFFYLHTSTVRWNNFKEDNLVYYTIKSESEKTREETKYSLNINPTKIRRGDIILVSTGGQKGRAIGIVQKNDYAELELNGNIKTHVLWINKSTHDLSGHTDDLIERLTGNSIKNGPEPDISDPPPETDTMKHSYPLNQILYGPPGTGKTWNTVNHAVAIIEDKSLDELEEEDREDIKWRFEELKKNGQIEMVTFHQNFTYEDFIEGIRPVLDEENEEIEYELSEGVFKKIADRANKNRTQSEQTGEESWDTDELLQAFAESIENKLESGEEINLFAPGGRSGATIGEIHWSRDNFKSVQLGGTVKYQRLTKKVIRRDYEDFYKGEIKAPKDIKPTHKSKRTQHGNAMYYFALYQKIKQFHDEEGPPEEPVTVEKQNYVLIIDEINRGNIAKIFGELITLIEPSKRIGGDDEATVALPYSQDSFDQDPFGVPDNLYIIGTMNTADRSIALLDTALRRRFEFIEMMPDSEHSRISTDIEGVNCQKLLAAMNKRIRFLLDREHQIGHTYFMGVDDLESLSATFKNQIIPLLQEYFYDNWEKIDLALNRNGFVHEISFESDLFKNSDLIDEERKIYELLPGDDGKWEAPESYQAIYEKEQGEAEQEETI